MKLRSARMVADTIARRADNALVLLLRGNVLVQHDKVRARFPSGVAWIEKAANNTLRVTVYGEDGVHVENSPEVRESVTALLELTTRGAVPQTSHLDATVE